MSEGPALSNPVKRLAYSLRRGWVIMRRHGPSQLQFWLIALAIGAATGAAAVGFRTGISALQTLVYGVDDATLASTAAELSAWWVFAVPIIGGLVVGLILDRFTPDGRVRAVADVIEGAALRDGRVEIRAGLASVVASLMTLGSGGSSGREGPVVHMAGVMSTWVARRIKADAITGRELLGCAVAAAVSASFNAPIAGALFALEVVLRHFAVHAFAPIAIASVAGTVVNRMLLGEGTEFQLPRGITLGFYVELPAFMMLGLICGLVAVALMRGIFLAEEWAEWLQRKTGAPRWLRPATAGLLLGLIAIPFPHIIGVGYETTANALAGRLDLTAALSFAVVKALAVAITLGGRMGGGVFSPALVTGALTGLGFGLIATSVFPHVSGTEIIYALAGMGAVAAAVLGAPISTAMIIFELTGDWQTGIAVMTAVSLSTALASRMVDQSFFLTQLERRGLHLAAGPQAWLPAVVKVADIMRAPGTAAPSQLERCAELIEEGRYIDRRATLETALPGFDPDDLFLPVVDRRAEGRDLLGILHQVDALRALNRKLSETAAEEHA